MAVQHGGALRRMRSLPSRAFAATVALGLVITIALAYAAYTTDRNNEQRLLSVQAKQAASVIGAAIGNLVAPLQTAFKDATDTGGNARNFADIMRSSVGPGEPFAMASLWRVDGGTTSELTSAGTAPARSDAEVAGLVDLATTSPTFLVRTISTGTEHRVSYALGGQNSPYVVYAERAIPADRKIPIENTQAFADLHFATYIGSVSPANLQTTDTPLDQLPLTGQTETVRIPFGDQTLLLVAAPARHFSGGLNRWRPVLLLVVGTLLSIGWGLVTARLVRRRITAEDDARTITELYARLDDAFAEQRGISETLQRALLPKQHPDIPHVEIASRYVAGARGVEVGGDWYTVDRVGDDRFAFVVGDVSGRGVEAAAIMARLRFAVRAYLLEGHPPELALTMCSSDLDYGQDGHMATALVGVGDLTTRQITMASAGHLNPLLVAGGSATFLDARPGPPLGVEPTRYSSTSFPMPCGAVTLLAYTDGLVERRDEPLDAGLARLAEAARVTADGGDGLDAEVTTLVSAMVPGGADDDLAVLALRWHPQDTAAGDGIGSHPASAASR